MNKSEKFLERLNSVRGKKPRKNSQTEKWGELFFQELMNYFNWDVFKNNLENDYGIDFWGQIFDNGEATSEMFGVQIKSGTSFYIPAHKAFKLYDNEVNLISTNYWYNLRIPAFLFFYSKDDKIFSFVEIHDWINNAEQWESDNGLPIVANKIYSLNEIELEIKEIKKDFYQKIKKFLSKQNIGSIIQEIDQIMIFDDFSIDKFFSICYNSEIRYSASIVLFTSEIIKKVLELAPKLDLIKEVLKWKFADWVDIYRYYHPNRKEEFSTFASNKLLMLDASIWAQLLSSYYMLDFGEDSPLFEYLYITHGLFIKNKSRFLSLLQEIIQNDDFSIIGKVVSLTFYVFYSTSEYSTQTIESLKWMNEEEIIRSLMNYSKEKKKKRFLKIINNFLEIIPTKRDINHYLGSEGLYCLLEKQKYFMDGSKDKEIPKILPNQSFFVFNIDIQYYKSRIAIMVIKKEKFLKNSNEEESILNLLSSDLKYGLTSTLDIDSKEMKIINYSNEPLAWETDLDAFNQEFGIDYRELIEINDSVLGEYKLDSTFRKLICIIEIQNKKFLIPNLRALPKIIP